MHLEANEIVIKVIRKHPFFIILQSILLLLLAVLPQILLASYKWILELVKSGSDVDLLFLVPVELQAYLYFLWLTFLWLLFFTRFTDYYLDKWVLTNQRIIDVEQKGFFAREVSSVRYQMIQDASVEVSGFLATIINFGTLQVQSAGAVQEFQLPLAPNPVKQKELIIDLKLKYGD